MIDPIWVDERVALALHDAALIEAGGASGVRDADLLRSALDRPRNKYAYGETDLAALAAAYAFGLAKNHAFIDGNKRTAFLVAAFFLAKNGELLDPDEAHAVLVMEGLAAGTVSEAELTEWIRAAFS